MNLLPWLIVFTSGHHCRFQCFPGQISLELKTRLFGSYTRQQAFYKWYSVQVNKLLESGVHLAGGLLWTETPKLFSPSRGWLELLSSAPEKSHTPGNKTQKIPAYSNTFSNQSKLSTQTVYAPSVVRSAPVLVPGELLYTCCPLWGPPRGPGQHLHTSGDRRKKKKCQAVHKRRGRGDRRRETNGWWAFSGRYIRSKSKFTFTGCHTAGIISPSGCLSK